MTLLYSVESSLDIYSVLPNSAINFSSVHALLFIGLDLALIELIDTIEEIDDY